MFNIVKEVKRLEQTTLNCLRSKLYVIFTNTYTILSIGYKLLHIDITIHLWSWGIGFARIWRRFWNIHILCFTVNIAWGD